jgi:hypothetical protein
LSITGNAAHRPRERDGFQSLGHRFVSDADGLPQLQETALVQPDLRGGDVLRVSSIRSA